MKPNRIVFKGPRTRACCRPHGILDSGKPIIWSYNIIKTKFPNTTQYPDLGTLDGNRHHHILYWKEAFLQSGGDQRGIRFNGDTLYFTKVPDGSMYLCPFGDYQTPKLQNLRMHILDRHKAANISKIITERPLDRSHIKFDRVGDIICNDCKSMFETIEQLRTHHTKPNTRGQNRCLTARKWRERTLKFLRYFREKAPEVLNEPRFTKFVNIFADKLDNQ